MNLFIREFLYKSSKKLYDNFIVLFTIIYLFLLLALFLFASSFVKSHDIDLYNSVFNGNISENIRNLLWSASILFGSYFAVVAIVNSLRRTSILNVELENNMYQKSIELLGSESEEVRLGSIYALESLMKTSFSSNDRDKLLGIQIGETLSSYIRNRSCRPKIESHPNFDDGEASYLRTPNLKLKKVSTDVEAAILCLTRSWPYEYRPNTDDGGVNISNSYISGIRFPINSDLRKFNFINCAMNEIIAERSNFDGSLLCNAELVYAWVKSSRFHNSDISGANFDPNIYKRKNDLHTEENFDPFFQKSQFDSAYIDEYNQPTFPLKA